ncbi:MAG: response regulator [Candidatus Margulisiibacteriota bacterium]|nr:response regulator [Candidatus Margulisiibacteriota bacterium]
MPKPLIMVVDDEIDLADSISSIIRETDKYDAVTAYSADQALELLTKNKIFFGLGGNRIRLIFLDIKMPGMNGLEFLKKIRNEFGEDIGVSMLTAWEDEEKWDKATAGFVVNYIKKPFKIEELITTINNYFKGREGKMVLDTFEKHVNKKEDFDKKSQKKKS